MLSFLELLPSYTPEYLIWGGYKDVFGYLFSSFSLSGLSTTAGVRRRQIPPHHDSGRPFLSDPAKPKKAGLAVPILL